jgi:hypothetical protein
MVINVNAMLLTSEPEHAITECCTSDQTWSKQHSHRLVLEPYCDLPYILADHRVRVKVSYGLQSAIHSVASTVQQKRTYRGMVAHLLSVNWAPIEETLVGFA